MSHLRLEEVFVTEMEMEEFLRSIARLMQAWCDYCDDSSQVQGFCNALGAFTVINAEQLKCLLQFYEKNIQDYQKYKDGIGENN